MLMKVAEHDVEKRQKWSDDRLTQVSEDYKTKAIKNSLNKFKKF